MIENLSVRNELDEQLPVSSNMESFCIECSATITSDNDSGWELFLPDGMTTQKVCVDCNKKEEWPQKKSE